VTLIVAEMAYLPNAGMTLAGICARGFQMIALLAWGIVPAASADLQPGDFAKSPTHFELDRYFVGHTRSWGVFENNDGNPRRYFTCDNRGRRDGDGDVALVQHFQFSDGKKQMRIWHIHRVDATHWEATANDMAGVAKGTGSGNAFYWEYTITIDRKDPLATVHVRQWMYQPEGTDDLMTRLVITKWGIALFEVSEVIHRAADESSSPARRG
jgi:hypothetical protein